MELIVRPRNDFNRIGIIGVGVVGGAVREYLEAEGLEPALYDPGKRLGSPAEIDAADLIFVCVPTPYVSGSGFDSSALESAFEVLRGEKTVVIKSTVLPGTTERLQAKYPQHRVLFNPEFLREATALDDFLQPDRQIVGHCGDDAALAQRILDLLPPAPYEAVVPARVAELTKYATNAFLAMKLIFANELHDLCLALGLDYQEVRRGFAADWRIAESHLDIHAGGYRGYAGKGLPKDTMALLDLAEDLGVSMSLLEAAHATNAKLRAPTAMQRREPPKATEIKPTPPQERVA
jgi:UDPglucose 6-dehydrogenase